jgi:O-antigen/teichoic acid export membrane protein
MNDLKERTIRSGSARLIAQGSNFALRYVSLIVLARLLDPDDYGLVGMVTAFTGVLFLFRDFGLSAASVQRENVTNEQTATLFWINLLTGLVLTLVAIAVAPVLGRFYHEPRLFRVTSYIAFGFLVNGAGVQHSALLQRQMRFTALAVIDTISLVISTAIAIVMAKSGYGYWALVAMTVSLPFTTTIALWITTSWIPGWPRRGVGMRSMMRFGGTMTLNGLVSYLTMNFDKVLLGRYWGSEAVGIYGRAYQLIRIPTDNLNSAIGEVAFAALSRVQNDPQRLRRYFLAGYSLVVAMTLPITIACALFSEDVVLAMLGPKWTAAARIFRLLAPTILVFAIANPLGWLLNSMGLVARGLKIALVFAPFMFAGYIIALPYGAAGIALAFSVVTTVWLIPFVIWALHGTPISVSDVLRVVRLPLFSSIVAGGVALGVRFMYLASLSTWPRLILEGVILLLVYVGLLLLVAGRKSVYVDVLRGFKGSASVEDKSLASA